MPKINMDICKGCGLCVDACLNYAIKIENRKAIIDKDICLECEACISICPNHAISSNIQRSRYPNRWPRPHPKYAWHYHPYFQRGYYFSFPRRWRVRVMKK